MGGRAEIEYDLTAAIGKDRVRRPAGGLTLKHPVMPDVHPEAGRRSYLSELEDHEEWGSVSLEFT